MITQIATSSFDLHQSGLTIVRAERVTPWQYVPR